MDKPFLYPFAKDGDRNTELSNENATDNSVSFQSGFTLPYELNPANGGKNLERTDMNEILFRICDAINNISQEIDKWVKLTTENLNSVNQNGRYYQPLRSQATSANNYPEQVEGYLFVISTISDTQTQIFKSAINNNFYFRYKIGDTWGEWIENLTTENAYKKSEVFTKIETTQSVGELIQLKIGNNVSFENIYQKQKLAVFCSFRASGLPNGRSTYRMQTTTSAGNQQDWQTISTVGGSADATLNMANIFNTGGDNIIRIGVAITSGRGSIEFPKFLGVFF